MDTNGDILDVINDRIDRALGVKKTSPSLVDTRDLRDPQKLGEIILNQAERTKDVLASADWAEREEVPNYPQDESMCMITQREYRQELEDRLREGDIYAKSTLERIDNERGRV